MIGAREARALALLFALVPQVALAAPDHVTLEEFALASDGDDYAPALRRLQVAMASRPSALLKTSGPTVRLAYGKVYQLGASVDVCLPLHFVGTGSEPGSGFQVKGPFTPFVSHAQTACPFELPDAASAKGQLTFERLAILDWRFGQSALRFGVDVKWPVVLRDVLIRGFVLGVYVKADATPTGEAEISNANMSLLEQVKITDSQGPGVYVSGADSNVIQISGGSVTGACTAGDHWAPLFRPTKYCEARPNDAVCTDPSMACAGYVDVSFLGGVYLSPHTASNKDLLTGRKFSGYVIAGESNRTVLVGPYSESFNCAGSCSTPGGGNFMAAQVQVIGGHSNWVGPGTWSHGNTTTSLVVENEKDPANRTTFAVGAPNSPGAFYEMRADADSVSKAWRSQYLLTGGFGGWYSETYANVPALTGILRSGEKSKIKGAPAPAASLWLPGPIYVGGSSTPMRLGQGPTVPVLDGTWPDGSRFRRTGTSSVGAVTELEAQTVASKRKWVPIARRQ